MRILFIVIGISYLIPVHAQTGSFQDPRDGITYETITLGDRIWFQHNLRYVSPGSWCTTHPDHPVCAHSNFYPYSELEDVCPTGWHLPTWDQWQQAAELIHKGGANGSAVPFIDTISYYPESYRVEGIDLFCDSAELAFLSTGWVEGKRLQSERLRTKYATATYWIRDGDHADSTTHVHVGSNVYIKHAHTHHIVDKPRKTRRFTVRCTQPK